MIMLFGQTIFKEVFSAPGVAEELIQLDAKALSKLGAINCNVGPFPSGSIGQGN